MKIMNVERIVSIQLFRINIYSQIFYFIIFNIYSMAGLSINLYGSVRPTPTPLPGSFGFSLLGKGLKGFIPQKNLDTNDIYSETEQQRFQLRQAWNNLYRQQLLASNRKRVITPFRAITNSGDVLSRKYYSCGGSCQTFQSRPNLRGLKSKFGSIQNLCDDTSVPASACNGKYVYDSSDYLTYLKQKAIVKNYNDLSNGGDDNNANQSILKAIRRY
jgi:hypothetical protein